MLRTRDLQKVERKNIKYRENNRVLSEAVISLENQSRAVSSLAGSGGETQNEAVVFYQNILRETNEDTIENEEHQQEEAIDTAYDNVAPETTNALTHTSDTGEHGQIRNAAGYFDNAQDEATGGEGHSKQLFEEEKVPCYAVRQETATDQQSSLLQAETNAVDDLYFNQNNNQTEAAHRANEEESKED